MINILNIASVGHFAQMLVEVVETDVEVQKTFTIQKDGNVSFTKLFKLLFILSCMLSSYLVISFSAFHLIAFYQICTKIDSRISFVIINYFSRVLFISACTKAKHDVRNSSITIEKKNDLKTIIVLLHCCLINQRYHHHLLLLHLHFLHHLLKKNEGYRIIFNQIKTFLRFILRFFWSPLASCSRRA